MRLVYLAPVEWHGLRQRPQEIAALLARDHAVTYVNPVATRNLSWRDLGRIPSFARGLRVGPRAPEPEAVRVVSLLHLPWAGNRQVDAVNQAILRREIAAKIAPEPGYTLCLAIPSSASLAFLRSTRPGRVIYDCMDHYSLFHQGEHAARMRAMEDEVLRRADLVFTSSLPLQRALAARHPNVVSAPNGANIELFRAEVSLSETRRPSPGLEGLPGPILGYCGTIGDWVDFELLEALAKAFSGGTLVLIGPWRAKGGRRLLNLPNVRWLGEIRHALVPAYCRRFDVGLIPFVLNELSEGVNPIKLYEYLALGLPVVSTAISEAMRHRPFVRTARERGEFLDAVRDSLRSDTVAPGPEERMRYATAFSWDKTGGIIQSALEPVAV